VDFWQLGAALQMMAPIVDELAKKYEGKNVKIGKCNVDENGEIRFQI